MKDDGYFKSINIQGLWYKNDPSIVATEASQVYFLKDMKLEGVLRNRREKRFYSRWFSPLDHTPKSLKLCPR